MLAEEQEHTTSKEQVLSAMDKAATRLCEKLGELLISMPMQQLWFSRSKFP